MGKLLRKLNLQLFSVDPTVNNTHISDNFGKLLEPGLRKIFFETYAEIPEQFPKVYNVNTSDKAEEKDYGLGAFGDWTQRASEVSTVEYKKITAGLERTYTHDAFTQGFMIGRELYDDEQYRQMDKMASALARSGRAKVEKDTAKFLITAFTANSYDGVPVFSNAHPLVSHATLKGKNLVTGPLNDANLKTGLKVMRETVDEAGNLIQLKAKKLIIPPALEDTAVRLLGSQQIVGGDLNDTNKFLSNYGIEIVVLDWLSATAGGSDTVWILQADQHELNFFWRVRPEFKWAEDFDTFVAKYRGYMRYSYGVSDWRGLVGSTGVVSGG